MALVDDLDRALGELRVLLDAADTDGERRRQAAMYIDEVTAMKARITATERRVTFIGPAGVGKTAALTALAGLYIGEAPTTPKELRERSVLPVGPGVTPAFPITVRAPGEGEAADRIGLVLTPMSERALRRMVEEVADYELFIRSVVAKRDPLSERWYAGRALRDVVLRMAGYAEGREIVVEDGQRRARVVRPLDAAMPGMDLPKLTAHLLGRCGFEARRRLRYGFPDTDEGRAMLKALLGRVSVGAEAEAVLPAEACVIWPGVAALGEEGEQWLLEERRHPDSGLNGARVGGQPLDQLDGLLVLCLPFTAPLSAGAVGALNDLKWHPILRRTTSRVALLVLDKDESQHLPGANGDREVGQLIQADQCKKEVVQNGFARLLKERQVIVFDALRDNRPTLYHRLSSIMLAHRQGVGLEEQALIDELHTLVLAPEAYQRSLARVDEALVAELKSLPPVEPPWIELAEWVPNAVDRIDFEGLRAVLRYEGTDARFSFFDLLGQIARDAAFGSLSKLLEVLDTLKGRDDLRPHQDVLNHLRRAWSRAIARVATDYGAAVRDEVEQLSRGAPVWREALAEFDRAGDGEPIRTRVVGHFRRWAQLQPFTAHRTSTLAKYIPQFAKLQESEETPGFTLIAENLRRLKHLRWPLQGVNLLIGASGSGKTTAIAAMRFMQRAYEVGVARAVVLALGGRSNLKSWGVGEDEPVRIALEQGQTRWEISLTPDAAGERVDVYERLTHRGEELLSVNALGRVTYRGLDLGGAGEDSGLRHLTRLQKVDPPINQMAALAQSLHGFRVPDLIGLKERGSNPQNDQRLDSQAGNTFAVLRRFTQEHASRARAEFVLDGLQLAFPGLVDNFEFRSAGNFLTLNIVPPGGRPPHGIGHEADGVLQCLVNLVAVASAEPGDVVALDQPDDHLHPYAARAFIHHVDRWAWEHKLTIIIATHSIVLLNEMAPTPERVFVMKEREGDLPVPAALTELHDEGWLQAFSLGDLYANDNLGSNLDGA